MLAVHDLFFYFLNVSSEEEFLISMETFCALYLTHSKPYRLVSFGWDANCLQFLRLYSIFLFQNISFIDH